MKLVHIFQTDLHTFRMTDDFIAQANARWPDRRCTRNPKWASKVHRAIDALAFDIYIGARRPVHTLKTLKTIEPYMAYA